MTLRYRIVRWLLRIWFAAVFRKVRLLGADDEARTGATVLLVAHPPRLLDTLLLVASFDRQLHCLINPETVGRFTRQFLVWTLGMIADTSGTEADSRAWVETCQELLGAGEAVVIAANPQANSGAPPERLMAVARMALEVESRPPVGAESAILPVHLLIPFARFNEALIHFGEPVYPRDFLAPAAGAPDRRVFELAAELGRAGEENPFALRKHDLVQVLIDLTEILRSGLADDWAARTNWKQTVEGFALSRFVAEWAEQTNRLDPDKLVTLREDLDAYREARRRRSLQTIQIDQAEWAKSTVRRGLAWVESALGLPVACYGVLNHIPAWLLISALGLWRKLRAPARSAEYAVAALILFAYYAAATALSYHWFGRSTAGYYAVSLPSTGVYLWRYARLWRHRTRLLLEDSFAAAVEGRLRRMRKELITRLEAARNAYADALGVAR
jgi:hypothetical protein